MCLERLNNGVRCRHNKHLALITESAVPYLATDQNSGHYSPGPLELGGGGKSRSKTFSFKRPWITTNNLKLVHIKLNDFAPYVKIPVHKKWPYLNHLLGTQ